MKTQIFKILGDDLAVLILFIILICTGLYFIFITSILDFLPYSSDFLFYTLLVTVALQYYRKNRQIRELGLFLDDNVINNITRSTFMIFSGMLLIFGAISVWYLVTGNISNLSFSYFKINLISDFAIYYFVAAAFEELLFRGLPFQILEDKFNTATALIVSSIAFSLMHSFNDNISLIAYLNIFLSGLLLGMMFVRSRSLYPPIFYHFFWNLLQGLLLNSNVSGNINFLGIINFDFSLFNGVSKLFFGGLFGIEEGSIATITLAVTLIMVMKYFIENPVSMAIRFRNEYSKRNPLFPEG